MNWTNNPGLHAPARIEVRELLAWLESSDIELPMLFDVRRRDAFVQTPLRLPHAVALTMVAGGLLSASPLPPPMTPLVVYCLCDQEASSYRTALQLMAFGYSRVSVLRGGLGAWHDAGQPLVPMAIPSLLPNHARQKLMIPEASASGGVSERTARLLRRAVLGDQLLPMQRRLAVLFVDMVGSSERLQHHAPMTVLGIMQRYWAVIAETAIEFCGELHDFEGDGALLYFSGAGEALAAADRMRTRLAGIRVAGAAIQARYALDYGELAIGEVGTAARNALCFVGLPIVAAARALRTIAADEIVATSALLDKAKWTAPSLVADFVARPDPQRLPGIAQPIPLHVSAVRTTDGVTLINPPQA